MPKKFWQFRNQAAGSAELLLYGDISDSSWWGDEVTPKTFADELNALGALTSLTVRINSGGGDVFAAQTIGNLLEQHTAQVTARIDGLCASAATIIACHCDKVVAANDSTYMIHPVRMGIFDFADAVTLQQYIDTGLYTAHTILYIRVEDYGPKPKIGKQLVLDKGTKSQRTYTINLCQEESGVYRMTMERTRQ